MPFYSKNGVSPICWGHQTWVKNASKPSSRLGGVVSFIHQIFFPFFLPGPQVPLPFSGNGFKGGATVDILPDPAVSNQLIKIGNAVFVFCPESKLAGIQVMDCFDDCNAGFNRLVNITVRDMNLDPVCELAGPF